MKKLNEKTKHQILDTVRDLLAEENCNITFYVKQSIGFSGMSNSEVEAHHTVRGKVLVIETGTQEVPPLNFSEGQQEKIKTEIQSIKNGFLNRIILCNIKNRLKDTMPLFSPEDCLSTVYVGRFCVIYTRISEGSKPVNKYEWTVNVEVTKEVRSLLQYVWSAYKQISWGWREEPATFYQRDFPSIEKAKGYGKRNRDKICKELIASTKQAEQQIQNANDNIDEVFDFRLLNSVLNPNYSGSRSFRVVSATKHTLKLSPKLTLYEIREENVEPYIITVKQKGYKLTVQGHRHSSQARDIRHAINNFFNTEFEAIEADTQQKVENPY
jgi:hypothetical protein